LRVAKLARLDFPSLPKDVPPSRTLVLGLLSVTAFLTFTVGLMLGPLLVELAKEFDTSVAIVGQLVGAVALTRIIITPLVGPLSDSYGRRLILLSGLGLMVVGVLGSVLAWNYGSLLAFRLVTGGGLAVVYCNCAAIIADIFPPENRGKAIGWLVSSQGMGAALGIGVVALLLDLGGWRLPFYVIGILLLILWALFWVWCPRSQRQPRRSLTFSTFFAHYKEVGSNAASWYTLAANTLQEMAVYGVFSYLAANLIQAYSMGAGETILPLALAGVGVITAGFIGGRVVDHPRRLALFAAFPLGGGLLAGLIFTTNVSPWATAALAFGAVALLRISNTVTPVLLLEMADSSRATATAMSSFSSQLGALGGASIGGLMLALGGFPMVGYFCLSVSLIAAIVVRLKVRDSAEFVQRMALRESQPAAVNYSPSATFQPYQS
jgi:DHA1 family inner membrane transport protein